MESLAAGVGQHPSRLELLAARTQQELAQARYSSPLGSARQSHEHLQTTSQTEPIALWRGMPMEELGERALNAIQEELEDGRTGRAGEDARRDLALMLDMDHASPVDVERQHAERLERQEAAALKERALRDAERERLLEDQGRHVERLERQLEGKELKVGIDVDAIAGAVVARLQISLPLDEIRLQLSRNYSQVMQMREELKSHAHTREPPQSPRGVGGAEMGQLRRISREIEEMREAFANVNISFGHSLVADLVQQNGRDVQASVDAAVSRCTLDTAGAVKSASGNMQALVEAAVERCSHDTTADLKAVAEALDRLEAKVDLCDVKVPLLGAIQNLDSAVLAKCNFDDARILDAIQSFGTSLENSTRSILRSAPDLTPLHDALAANRIQLSDVLSNLHSQTSQASSRSREADENQRNVMDAIKASRADLFRALESIDLNVDHSEVIHAIAGGHDRHASVLQQMNDHMQGVREHIGGVSSAHSMIDSNHQNLLAALGSLDLKGHHSDIIDAITGGHDRHASVLQQMQEQFGGLSSVHDKIDDHHQHLLSISEATQSHPNTIQQHLESHSWAMLKAFEAARTDHGPVLDAIGNLETMRIARDLRELGQDTAKDDELLFERIVEGNREVVAVVEAAKSEHSVSLRALHQLVAEAQAKAEFSVLQETIRTSSRDGVEDNHRQHLPSVGGATQHHPNMIQEHLEGHSRNIGEHLEGHSRNMLQAFGNAFSELQQTMHTRSRDGVEGNHQISAGGAIQNPNAIQQHLEGHSRDMLQAFEAARTDHAPAIQQHLAGHSRDMLQAFEAARTDHAPVLRAMDSLETRHFEVLTVLRQLRLDLHMEPDFSPVLRAIGEIPSRIQDTLTPHIASPNPQRFTQLQPSAEASPSKASDTSFAQPSEKQASPSPQRYIVTLGNRLGASPLANAVTAVNATMSLQ